MRKENEEFVIRRSLKISQKKLEFLGWKKKGTIPSGTEIFKKGNDFCFWDPKTRSIVRVFMSTHV